MLFAGICLMTKDVRRLAAFYRALLGVETDGENDIHMAVLVPGAELAIMRAETDGAEGNENLAMMFTVEDVDAEYPRVQSLGAEIISPPTLRPWGAKNMLFKDIDGNTVAFRSLPK